MQTRISSFIENLCDTASGFIIALIIVQFVLPLYGYKINLQQATEITFIFTCVSIIRGYIWRRYFNSLLRKKYGLYSNKQN